MPGNDRSRLGEGGSDKTIAAVNRSIEPTDDAEAAAWWKAAQAAIQTLAHNSAEPFTADTLRGLVGDPPVGHQLSVVFAVARRRRQITSIGAVEGRGGGLLRIWRGTR
jgi:hypothetical protein